MLYLADELVTRVKQLDDFISIPSGFWIIGIRNPDDKPDSFDDMFYLMKGEELLFETTGTTNPGLRILKGGFKRFNKVGSAVVQADRIYYNVWKYGLHLGYMPSLKQLGAKITVFRDGNLNDKSEEIGDSISGYYGINFHTATRNFLGNVIKKLIGGWSAGCQVCNVSNDYMFIIKTVKNQKNITYCLLNEFSI